jgi:hypothetical protein
MFEDAGKRAANEMTVWGGGEKKSLPFHAGATQKKIVEARVHLLKQ